MSKLEISRAVIFTHSHATEDLDKVRQAILNILPQNLRKNVVIEEEAIEGYYKNIIHRLKVVLEGDQAVEFLRNLLSSLSESDRSVLINTLDIRYNKKSNELYIRLDKQEAYLGLATLYDGDDVIKIAIAFAYKRSLEDIRRLIESLAKGHTDAR